MEQSDDVITGLRRTLEERRTDLRARSKPRDSLITPIDCTVISVDGYITGTTFTPRSELRIGGESPNYSGGDSSRLEIAVRTETPIKLLACKGLLPIEKGDSIRAYILKAREEYEEQFLFGSHGRPRAQSHYVEREFTEKETPLKIEKLRDGAVVATYHLKL